MSVVSRRAALGAIGAAVVGAPAVLRGRYRVSAQSPREYSARAVTLLQQSTVVDLLNQFLFPDFSEQPPKIDRWLRQPGAFGEVDAAVYRRSGIHALCLGAGVGTYDQAVRFFANWNGFIAGHDDVFLRIDDAGDFARARESRRVGIALTSQDSSHLRTLDDVDTFWGLGQRISQLTYNFNNGIGSGFLEQRDGGLSAFGLSILERMQKVGMAVDVSHCGDQTTLDALSASTRPVVFTHATCRALLPGHLRCKTDEAIRAMAKSGGVMGIAFIRFMVRDREPVTIEHALDHVDHVARLVGVQHVAVGSDVDIMGNPTSRGGGFDIRSQPNYDRYRHHEGAGGRINIEGLDHPERMFDLAEGLIRRGYRDADIALMLGGNAVRVLGEIWKGTRAA